MVAWGLAAVFAAAFVADVWSTRQTLDDGRIVVGTVAATTQSNLDIGYVIVDIPDVGREEVDMTGSDQSTAAGDEVHLRVTNASDAYPVPADVTLASTSAATSGSSSCSSAGWSRRPW